MNQAKGVGHDDKKVPASDRVKILTREEIRWSHCLDTRLYRIYSYNYAGKSSKARSSFGRRAPMAEKSKNWEVKGLDRTVG